MNVAAGGRPGEHFVMLDALRGVAAIMVMAHHLELSGVSLGLFPRAYLAVDFFFMLSGFVLSRAYDYRFADGLGWAAFMRIRLRRLWPTMAIGIALGVAVAWGGGMPHDLLAMRTAAALLFVPLALHSVHLFVLDGAQWSLFFELIANALHGGPLKCAPVASLCRLLVVSIILLFGVAYFHGDLTVGYVATGWIGGLARVMAAYVAGMLLYRLWLRNGHSAPRKNGGWALGGLVVALIGPAFCPAGWWWLDPLVVVAVFPPVLWLGATAAIAPRWRGPATFGGAMSYPLYAFHMPMLALGERLGDSVGGAGFSAFRVAGLLLAVALAWLWSRAEPGLPRLATRRSGSIGGAPSKRAGG
jgi:peptidoglycan/LPS O-acetylase OafA/YrhL